MQLEIFQFIAVQHGMAVYSKYIGNVREEGGIYKPLSAEVLLPGEPISQYNCKNLFKTGNNDRTHKKWCKYPFFWTSAS